MNHSLYFRALALLIFLCVHQVTAQTAAEARQLARALQECEQDLQTSLWHVDSLGRALSATNDILERHKQASDQLIDNLNKQIDVQMMMIGRYQANSDTMDVMLSDYRFKLDEVSDLYRYELKQNARPWFLTWHGLQGLGSGLLVGGVLGLFIGLAN